MDGDNPFLRFLKDSGIQYKEPRNAGERSHPPAEPSADENRQLKERYNCYLVSRVAPPGIASVLSSGEMEQLPAVVAALDWASKPVRGLMLRGGVGSGKSVAAAVAMRELISMKSGSASWHTPNAFVSAVMHSYDENAPKLGLDVVVVDDVGRETKADFCEALCEFIDTHSTRFVLTTNLTRDDFKQRYDARLIDRLNHYAKAIAVKGPSRRRQDGGF